MDFGRIFQKHKPTSYVGKTLVAILLLLSVFLIYGDREYQVIGAEIPTTVEYRPIISTDETRRNCNNVGCGILAFFTNNIAMGETSSASYDYRSHIVFRSINIPQGSQINSATLTLVGASFSGTSGLRTAHIYGDDRDTSIAPTDATEFDAIAKTTANVNWSLSTSTWVGNTHISPDITTIIQEIIDRPSWETDNNMGIFWGDFTDDFQFSRLLTAVPTIGSGNEPLLTIEYVRVITPGTYIEGWRDFLGAEILLAIATVAIVLFMYHVGVPFLLYAGLGIPIIYTFFLVGILSAPFALMLYALGAGTGLILVIMQTGGENA